MRTWIWTSIVGLLLLTAAVLLSIKPGLRWLVEDQAKARGVDLSFERLQLRSGGIRLLDVRLRPRGVEQVTAELDEVRATLGFTSPRLRSLAVLGGRVEVSGSVESLREDLAEWRNTYRGGATQAEASPTEGGSDRRVRVSKVDVIWTNALGAGSEQRIQGFELEAGNKGAQLGADLIEMEFDGVLVQIAGAKASASSLGQAHIDEMGAAEMRVQIRPTETQDDPAPAADAAQRKDAALPSDAGSNAPQPNEGDAENGPNPLERFVTPRPERTAVLQQALRLLRERVLPRLPQGAQVERLWVSYQQGEDQLRVGPNRLQLEQAKQSVELRLTPTKQVEGTPLSFVLRIPRAVDDEAPSESAALSLEVAGGPVRLSTLGVEEGAFSLTGVDRTTLQGKLTADVMGDARTLRAQGELTVQGLTVDHRKLSDSLVSFPRLYLQGHLHAATDGSHVSFSDVEVGLGEARFEGEFALAHEKDGAHLQARAQAPLVSCQALVDSAPRGLLGPVEHLRFDGTFSLQASVDAHTNAVEDMRVTWDFKNGCNARAVPGALDPDQFRGVFRREVLGAGGFPMEVEFGPHSGNWVDYENVSSDVEAAILVCEDGRFFRHDGFDDRAIESAILDNTKAGSFVRGASTVSMQLAKNLYLSRDKTLSRKFQEAALTSLLEQSFSKKELLELYVNVVEFGPGIYGISQAAAYYFNQRPDELSTSQAFFLISLLPAPTRDYFEADGSLKDYQLRLIRRLMKIAYDRGRLNDAELEEALLEEPTFGESQALPPDVIQKRQEETEQKRKEAPPFDPTQTVPAPREQDEGVRL